MEKEVIPPYGSNGHRFQNYLCSRLQMKYFQIYVAAEKEKMHSFKHTRNDAPPSQRRRVTRVLNNHTPEPTVWTHRPYDIPIFCHACSAQPGTHAILFLTRVRGGILKATLRDGVLTGKLAADAESFLEVREKELRMHHDILRVYVDDASEVDAYGDMFYVARERNPAYLLHIHDGAAVQVAGWLLAIAELQTQSTFV